MRLLARVAALLGWGARRPLRAPKARADAQIARRPDDAEAHYDLALAALRRGDHLEASGHLQRAIAARPDYADAHNAFGACALELGDAERAAAAFAKAAELRPDDAHVHSNLGYVLFRDLGEYERGAQHLRRALALNRHDAGIWSNYCLLLAHEGQLDQAVSVYDQLLAAKPDLMEARLNRALALLALGRFAQGWPDYEARKRVRSNYVSRPYALPDWHGEPLAGKTVLAYTEQGLGDEILFASCLPDLLNEAGRVLVECSPRLEGLFRRSFPAATVRAALQTDPDVSWLATVGAVDYQVAIGSLPGFFRRESAAFPPHAGYLRADPARVDDWRDRLRALGPGPKIGISWRGGLASTRITLRSTALAAWLPLLQTRGCQFVSLQYGDVGAELAALVDQHKVSVHHWPPVIADLDETAALIKALDLVISVQTAVVDLAGALGQPVWVLVPAVAEWRYMASGDTMPWYPTVRLLRQPQPGDWESVIARAARDLERLALEFSAHDERPMGEA